MSDHARFDCSVCGKEAGSFRLELKEGRLWWYRDSFTSAMYGPVPDDEEEVEWIRSFVADPDPGELYELNFELASFYCPSCAASYCGEHWFTWDVFDEDGWHDSIRGRCPQGHERMLED
jgi:hypothetical protein